MIIIIGTEFHLKKKHKLLNLLPFPLSLALPLTFPLPLSLAFLPPLPIPFSLTYPHIFPLTFPLPLSLPFLLPLPLSLPFLPPLPLPLHIPSPTPTRSPFWKRKPVVRISTSPSESLISWHADRTPAQAVATG